MSDQQADRPPDPIAVRELFFFSPTHDTALTLTRALQVAGFHVPDSPEPPDEDGDRYCVTAYTGYRGQRAPGGRAELATIHEAAERLAEEHDSVYDGGGEWLGALDGVDAGPTAAK